MAFEDILRSINEQTDRDSLASMAAKYPSLREFAELGERVAPLRTRLQKLEYSDFDPAIQELENWRGWKNANYNNTTRMTFEEERVKQALATATAKINELELRSDTDMTPEEVRQIVQESVTATLAAAGVVDNKALEAKLTGLVTNEKLDQYTHGLTTRFEDVYAKLTPKITEHARTFEGEILDPTAVFAHMKKTGKMDPLEAYNDMVAPRLAEKQTKDWEAKVAAAEKAGEEKGRREVSQSSTGRGMPVDGKGGNRLGVLQRRVMERNNAKTGETTSAPLGKGVIAATAAAQHRERELAGAAS